MHVDMLARGKATSIRDETDQMNQINQIDQIIRIDEVERRQGSISRVNAGRCAERGKKVLLYRETIIFDTNER